MVRNKDTERKEEEDYEAEALRRLELAEADEKKIKAEINALKKEIEEARKAREDKVIDSQWATEEIALNNVLGGVAARKKKKVEKIIHSDEKEELPELIDFSPKQHVYVNKESGKGKDDPEEDKRKGKEEGRKERNPQEKDRLRPSAEAFAAAKNEKFDRKDVRKEEDKGHSAPEAVAAAITAAGVAAALKRSEKTKLKEVARGVSAVSAIQAEQRQKTQINPANNDFRLASAGLSREAEKRLMKEERRQEREFKKFQKENEKGITASRTESRFVTKDGEKADKGKSVHTRTAGENQRKAYELRRAELEKKIENLRERLEALQRKRLNSMAKARTLPNKQNEVRFTAAEAKALPSVKAGRAMEEAFKAKELPEAEKGGAVSEASLIKMENSAEKAAEKIKTATLVPDYATTEFKRKAAEQGIELNKSKSDKNREEKKADRQKLLALSGRPGAEESFEPQENGQKKERSKDRQELRIDPEKSRANTAEKTGKEINMQQYQMAKELRGGRMTG